jgi:hypothetical protein
LNDQAFDLNTKSCEEIKECTGDITTQLSEKVVAMTREARELQKQIESFREVTNNMFDDQQSTLIKEFQEGVGGLMKQNLDNYDKLKVENNAQTKDIVKQIDASTENLTSMFEATNAHMDKINENINVKMEQTEDQFRKEMNAEITDLRSILSTIRSDIELMKSVLTKIDTKIH